MSQNSHDRGKTQWIEATGKNAFAIPIIMIARGHEARAPFTGTTPTPAHARAIQSPGHADPPNPAYRTIAKRNA